MQSGTAVWCKSPNTVPSGLGLLIKLGIGKCCKEETKSKDMMSGEYFGWISDSRIAMKMTEDRDTELMDKSKGRPRRPCALST